MAIKVPAQVNTMMDSVVIAGQSIYEASAIPKNKLGAKIQLPDGRVFYYAKAGSTALVAGQVYCSPTPVSNHLGCAVAEAASVGDTRVKVTLSATAATKDQYAEGYLHINDAAGSGNYYKIKSNPAIASSGTGYIYLYDPLQEALTTSSKATLTANPFNGIVKAATTLVAPVVGVPIIDVPANNYCWIQTWGPAAVLTQGTLVIGQTAGPSGATAGAVAAVGVCTTPVVGFVAQVNANGEYSLIFLRILP